MTRILQLVSRRYRRAILLGLALLLYLPALGARDIVTSHEARVAQTARLMAMTWPWEGRTATVPEVALVRTRDGGKRLAPVPSGAVVHVNPWLVPVLNGQIRLQKPPLPYWCAAVLFRLFGFSEMAARVTPALMGAGSALLVFSLGRMLRGRALAWAAAGVWIGSYFVFDENRKAMADPYLAFFTLLCLWAWVRWAKRAPARPTARLVVLFYLALALGFLAKGYLIGVHVVIALVAYHLCWPGRAPGRWRQHLAGVALFAVVALPWYAYALMRVPHAMDIWHYESVGEVTDENMRNPRQWWFYAPMLFLVAAPWTPVLVTGVAMVLARARPVRREPAEVRTETACGTADVTTEGVGTPVIGYRDGSLPEARVARPRPRADLRPLFPLLWYAATAVAFSLVSQKKNAYLLPVMPAQTLLIGQALVWLVAALRRSHASSAAGALATAQAGVGVAFGLWLLVDLMRSGGSAITRCTGVALAVTALALAIYSMFYLRGRRPMRWAATQALTYGLLAAVFAHFSVARDENARSPRPVARAVGELLARDPGLTLNVEHLPEQAACYLPLPAVDESRRSSASRMLVIIDDTHGVKTRKASDSADTPAPRAFRGWVDEGEEVVEVRRVPLAAAPGDARWKVYELKLHRSPAAPAYAARP